MAMGKRVNEQECYYGANPTVLCFVKLRVWESLQKA